VEIDDMWDDDEDMMPHIVKIDAREATELTAANEQIRKLEEGFDRTINDYEQILAAEREVLLAEQALSDKLEKALIACLPHLPGEACGEYTDARAALAEVARIRSQNTSIR